MAYVKTDWKNKPDMSTPINATNLNKIEDGISNLYSVTLYENASGTQSTITLSQSYTDFLRIGVYAEGQSDNYSFYNEMLTTKNYMILNSTCINDESYNMLVWRLTCITFTGNIVTFFKNGAGSLTAGPDNYLTLGSSDGIKITRVIGYKS